MNSKNIAKAVMTTLVGSTLVTGVTQTAVAADKPVKCYGVAEKGKNDCGTPKHACAGQSKKDGQPDEWIYMSKGNCKRVICGSLKPSKTLCKYYDPKALESA